MILLHKPSRSGRITSTLLLASSWALLPAALAADFKPAPQEFQQEMPRQWPAPAGSSAGGLTLVDAAPDGTVRVADGQRWYTMRGDRLEVLPPPAGSTAAKGHVFVGTTVRTLSTPLSTVRHIQRQDDVVWLATTKGIVRLTATESSTELPNQAVRQIATGRAELVLAATARGLWRRDEADKWEQIRVVDDVGRVWAEGDVRGVAVDGQGSWWVATPAGVARRKGDRWSFFTGRDGLPYADFTCVAIGAGSEVWFGTHRGAVRFDGKEWAYREGQLWLPGNDVRSIAVGADGRAWFATDKGLGCIERRAMTLAEKAAHYAQEVERCITRTPFGYLSEVGLGAPGDRSKINYSDSDNDGLWTAMYGAGECFAYAATKAP
ncbi:MAG: two-component regulator propeller domain-containing protein, partial [Verrucomicrobiota bacterium]